MQLQTGSSHQAHSLDRFTRRADVVTTEDVAIQAALLDVDVTTAHTYLDWYGAQVVSVRTHSGVQQMPRYAAYLLADRHGQPVKVLAH
jgi:hypothetical protein